MKTTLLTLMLAVIWPISAQRKTEIIESKKLNASREVTIVTPASYETNKKKEYPLLVLLDGDYLLDPFAGTLSYTEYWNDLPEVIIVAINQNNDEERTLDTQTDDHGVPMDRGDKFFEFLSSELMPMIEKKYRVSPFRIIAGHGLTAGYINFFLYKEKPLFNAYICMSPDMPVDMENRIPERLTQIQRPTYYYLATAEGDVPRLQKPIKTLNDNIKAVTNQGLKYMFEDFKGCSHYSLVVHAIPESLYHIFSSYQPISSTEYQEKIVKLTSGYAKYLEQRYDVMEKDLGVKIPVRLNDLKAIEAAIIKNGAYTELRELSDIAEKNYPKTTLGDYYTGLYYEKTGDNKKAIKAYMHSYTLDEIGEYTKDFMLEKAEKLKAR
ncbi:alpha/beta hydrolase-fold protein [Flavobacterium sp. DGU11]|uniref:Alpha/beta hydrolase-fold protein n=1 Tax=Flavobacterium arundinis TaxID=3139143 RepID=A0ABU9HXN2_9FLAO